MLGHRAAFRFRSPRTRPRHTCVTWRGAVCREESMVSVEALLSGLVGAVIGAVIGGLLTFAVQRDDRNHRETMAARVVFIEATTNETFLEALIDGLVAGPILDVAWS